MIEELVTPMSGHREQLEIRVGHLGLQGWRAAATVYGKTTGFAEPFDGRAAPTASSDRTHALVAAADRIRERVARDQLSPDAWSWLPRIGVPRGSQPDLFEGMA